ncbi:hypothetical protein HUG17_3659 [Dermatophagoides farinae]|uniref:Integrase catalytic domain-containing protein n=1 Tax=Dermatophagoides farinae TaxID=6954 RepID=A0A9D4NV61_DERFA|nr:hypothetical protein HUG17_3659 [Dermatophagoides farinae]
MSNKEFNVVKTLKLGEVTYRQWYVTLLDALEALDLDDFVKDFKYIRNDGDVAITKEEKGRIAKVKNIIRLSISNEDLESIMECNNPKEMISELDRKYRGPGAKSAWEILRDFNTIKFEGSIQGLFAKLRQLFAAFADKNIKLPSYFINSKVRAILPAEYDEMCKMVDIYNGGRSETDYMSDKQFESELLRFEREKNLKFSAQNTSLAATIKSNNSSTLLNKKKFNGTCYYCKIKGHIEKFCRKKMNDSKSGQQNNEVKPSNENKLASLSAVVKISDIDCHMNQLSSNVSSSLSLVSVSSVKFLADCGASNHIVNDRSLLSNIRKTSHQIITMSGVVNGPEQGDMKCQLFNGKSWVPMVIRDVYYVAGQPFNLIAIGKICRRENVRSVTNNDGITIYHKEVPILIGEWSTEYLNIIELRIRIDVSSSKNIVNVAVNSMAKWHERFGHFSTNTIGKMFKQKLVDGIPNSLNNDIDYCTPCKIGKLTDISHHIESDNPHILPEFRSELFQNYLSGHGIIHEKASVNTPQQNGRCERAMRTLMDHAISMLLSTDLPRFLWDEAVNCSAYLMNLVLNSRNEIPYEKYFGIKPDVSNLRIFGSEGQALNKNRNNKFDAKSKFVRMIGYEGQTIYRVYVSGARRVELCSSVDFDEKPKCVVQPIGFDVNKSTINNCESESNTVISFVDSRDDDVPNQPDSNFRGPGRPIGAKNRLFQQSEERLQSLRVLPGRSIKDNEFTMLCLYVDDALLASNIPGKVKSLFEEIGQIFEIRSVDSCKYLGINYTRNHLSKTIMLYQYDYLIGKLKMFNMADSRKVDTPLAAGIDPYQQSSSNMAYPYRQAIGALLYLSCKTRPDIAFCVSLLARFADKTTDIHDVRFVLNVLENLEILIDKPVINCDNQAAVKQLLAENISLKLRHINIKFLMVRDLIQRGLMSIQWISSDAQLADVLTKPLSRKNLISFVENLPLYDFVKTGEC